MGVASSHDTTDAYLPSSCPPSRAPSSSSPPSTPPPLFNGQLSEFSSTSEHADVRHNPPATTASSSTSPSTASSSIPPVVPSLPSIPTPEPLDPSGLSPHLNAQAPTSPSATEDFENDHVPTLLVWNSGGDVISVVGSWDNWQRHVPLELATNGEHCTLLLLQPGEFHLKFLVDGIWQCVSYLPTCVDLSGNINNTLIVHPPRHEFDTLIPLNAPLPSSPTSSYNCRVALPSASEPPPLPPQLEARALKPLPEDISPAVRATQLNAPSISPWSTAASVPRPAAPGVDISIEPHDSYRPFFSHIFINHLYLTRSASAAEEVQTISQTSRVGRKIVNTVYVYNPASPTHLSSTPDPLPPPTNDVR